MTAATKYEIPIVDVGPMIRGEPGGVERVGRELARACDTIGFFYAVGHGVAEEVVAGAFAQAERFFAWPLEERMKIRVNEFSRGYFPLEQISHPEGKGVPDLKESFDFGLDIPLDDPDVAAGKLHGPNIWPDLPGFRAPVEAYFAAVRDFGFRLLPAFAAALDLPHDYFQKLYRPRPIALARLIRYPPRPAHAPDRQLAAAAHTDYGFMTILAQDDAGGLQLKPRDAGWLPAPCIPGTFIVNLGDLLAQWTNGRFMSMPHRVVHNADRHRLSIAFFYHPSFDTRVECLPTCRSTDNPPRYQPVGFGEYILGKYGRIFAHKHRGSRPTAAA